MKHEDIDHESSAANNKNSGELRLSSLRGANLDVQCLLVAEGCYMYGARLRYIQCFSELAPGCSPPSPRCRSAAVTK
jgi:hypothetical protein